MSKRKNTLKNNDIVTLNITGMTSQGSGVGRTKDDMVVFVPIAAVGDSLKVRITKVRPNYAQGRIEEIVKPSKNRVKSKCEYFTSCGGCAYRHISYEEELNIKDQTIKDAVSKIGKLDNVTIKPIVKAENTSYYRNKAQIPIGVGSDGKPIIGYYAFNSHRIIDCDYCLLQPKEFSTIMNIVKTFITSTNQKIYDEEEHTGKLRHLYIRYGEETKDLMVCIVVNGKSFKHEDVLVSQLLGVLPNIKSIVVNYNREKTNVVLGQESRVLYGKEYIKDTLCGLNFKISPLSFYQINRKQAESLYTIAKEYANLKEKDVLLDLYCGTGTIALTMANSCSKVIGIEIVEEAVKDARLNAKNNNIENALFICEDASNAVQMLYKDDIIPNVVVVDPPRKGCSSEVIDVICKMEPEKIVYVSCNPATLARDLKKLNENGFITSEITPVDMFPKTAHVETVVLMSRVEK